MTSRAARRFVVALTVLSLLAIIIVALVFVGLSAANANSAKSVRATESPGYDQKFTPPENVADSLSGTTPAQSVGQLGRSGMMPHVRPGFAASGNMPSQARDFVRARMRRDFEGLEPIRFPDGRVSVDLQGRFAHFSTLVVDENGEARIQCFSDPEALIKSVERQP